MRPAPAGTEREKAFLHEDTQGPSLLPPTFEFDGHGPCSPAFEAGAAARSGLPRTMPARPSPVRLLQVVTCSQSDRRCGAKGRGQVTWGIAWGKAALTLLLLWRTFVATGNPELDSLTQLLRTRQPDTSRVLTLMELSFAYRGSRPDLAVQHAQTGLRLARQINFRRGEASCLNCQGLAYLALDDRPRALHALLASLRLNEALLNRQGMAANLANVALVYDLQDDHRTALRYAFRAKALATVLHREADVTLLLLNIGGSYADLGRLDSALQYTRQGYQRARRGRDEQNLIIAHINLGSLYLRVGRPALAQHHYRQALPYCRRMGHVGYLSVNYLNIAQLFEGPGQTDSLLRYARLALTTAKRHKLDGPMLDASKTLAAHFTSQHQPDSAVRYLELAAVARDSLYNQEKLANVQRLLFVETIRQQERQAAQVQAQEMRRYNLQLLAIAIFVMSVSVLLLLFRRRVAQLRVAGVLGVVTLLMVFEFVALLTGPTIERLTGNRPVLTLLAMVGLAAGLAPLHHRLERWVKQRLTPSVGAGASGDGPLTPAE